MNEQTNLSQRDSRTSVNRQDILQNLYRSIDSKDTLKLMEVRQIEQEQYYVMQLREQREKMETLKFEFERRERTIQEQAQTIQFLTEQNEGLNELRNTFEELMQRSEMETLSLGKMKAEKELLEKNIERLKEELKMRDSTIYSLRSNNDKINVLQRETEDALNKYKKIVRERDDQNFEQLNQLQLQFQSIQDENFQLKDEISKLDETLFGLDYVKEQNTQLLMEIKNQENNELQRKKKMEKLEHQIEELKSSLKQVVKEASFKEQQYQQELFEYRTENERMIKIQKKFENSLQDVKTQLKESEKRCLKVQEEIPQLRQELQRVRVQEREAAELAEKYEKRVREMENEFNILQIEVNDSRQKLKSFMKKEEQDRKVKGEIEKVRQDLISVRNSEVQKMNNLFDDFMQTANAKSNYGSSNKKISTPQSFKK